MLQRVVHDFSQAILRQHRVHGIVEPGFELGQERNSSLLSRHEPLLIGETLDLPLDAEELLVEGQRLMGSARALQQVSRLDEASARMRVAGDFRDPAGEVKRIVPGIGIGPQVATVVFQERQGRIPGAGLGELPSVDSSLASSRWRARNDGIHDGARHYLHTGPTSKKHPYAVGIEQARFESLSRLLG